jgi:hypothetical protein
LEALVLVQESNLPDYVKVEDDHLWYVDVEGVWHQALERAENENDEQLFSRWKDQKVEELTKAAMQIEIDRINGIISWIAPFIILGLGILLGSFFE